MGRLVPVGAEGPRQVIVQKRQQGAQALEAGGAEPTRARDQGLRGAGGVNGEEGGATLVPGTVTPYPEGVPLMGRIPVAQKEALRHGLRDGFGRQADVEQPSDTGGRCEGCPLRAEPFRQPGRRQMGREEPRSQCPDQALEAALGVIVPEDGGPTPPIGDPKVALGRDALPPRRPVAFPQVVQERLDEGALGTPEAPPEPYGAAQISGSGLGRHGQRGGRGREETQHGLRRGAQQLVELLLKGGPPGRV